MARRRRLALVKSALNVAVNRLKRPVRPKRPTRPTMPKRPTRPIIHLANRLKPIKRKPRR